MQNYLGALVALTLGTVVNSASLLHALHDANRSQLISEAIGVYNRESDSAFVAKLYKDDYEYKLGPNGQKEAKFTVKETVCGKSENRALATCDYKPGALEKRCSATMNDDENTLLVVCSADPNGNDGAPGSGDLDTSSHLEKDYPGQQEDGAHSEEPSVIITDDPTETVMEPEDEDERRIIEEFLRPVMGIEKSGDTRKKTFLPGQIRARFLCLE
ncbi:cathelicidin antimicrobial peptide-like isoform X2 [Pseudophryne corroboree]